MYNVINYFLIKVVCIISIMYFFFYVFNCRSHLIYLEVII